ncbi:TerD family protein, partial [Streptomyces griseus]|uniref:TerD family protein n=1 Tax=Streptomyces griseus TaxID=1911 RepID=UPI0033E0C266
MTAMTPGSNIPLSAARVAVDVAAPVRLDVSGLLLTADGKVRSDDDFIFYNQPSGPGVTYRSGGGSAPDAVEDIGLLGLVLLLEEQGRTTAQVPFAVTCV